MKIKYLPIIIIFIIGIAYFSAWNSRLIMKNDFAVFYRAANIVYDNDREVKDVYSDNLDDSQKYNIPPQAEPADYYRYSILATYLLSPLAFLDYQTADAVLIFVNIIAYFASLIMILVYCGCNRRKVLWWLVLSAFWMPFLQNIRWSQINAVLLLLVTVAVFEAKNGRNWSSGILLAVASLFKPYVLPVTAVISLKSWRLLPAYVGVIAFDLICLPGAVQWYHSFLWPPHDPRCYSFIYQTLQNIGSYQFWLYAALIGAITATVVWFNKTADLFGLTALAIPASLLAMPLLEIHYSTLLIFTFTYLITQRQNPLPTMLTVLSFIMVYVGSTPSLLVLPFDEVKTNAILYFGVLTIWMVMIFRFMNHHSSELNVDSGN